MATNGTNGTMKMLCNPSCTTPDHCEKTSCAVKCWKWDVTQITMNEDLHTLNYSVIVLNRPITHNHRFILKLWDEATIRMTVDGGTREWDKFIGGFPDDVKKNIKDPDLVSGDFDSISDAILEKYTKKGCKVIYTPDQNRTDFTKALMEINTHCKQIGIELSHIIVVAETSGRIDQIVGNIQTLFLVKEELLLDPKTNVILMANDSMSWLLLPGDHVIVIPEETRKHKRTWCSLVPIGECCQYTTTTGLKWNLDNQMLRFGAIVSTSNNFDGSERVTVKCSHTLLWSMKIPMLETS